jgi:hypothetical protein
MCGLYTVYVGHMSARPLQFAALLDISQNVGHELWHAAPQPGLRPNTSDRSGQEPCAGHIAHSYLLFDRAFPAGQAQYTRSVHCSCSMTLVLLCGASACFRASLLLVSHYWWCLAQCEELSLSLVLHISVIALSGQLSDVLDHRTAGLSQDLEGPLSIYVLPHSQT